MSEPYSCFLQAKISPERLRRWLASPVAVATRYPDWNVCTGFIALSEPEAWRRFLASVPGSGQTYGQALRALRDGTPAPFFRFYFDEATSVLSQATFLYAQGALELVYHLTLSRGIAEHMEGDETGLAAVDDPFMGNGTVGLVELAAARSAAVVTDATRIETHRATIDGMTQELRRSAKGVLKMFSEEREPSTQELAAASRDELDRFLACD